MRRNNSLCCRQGGLAIYCPCPTHSIGHHWVTHGRVTLPALRALRDERDCPWGLRSWYCSHYTRYHGFKGATGSSQMDNHPLFTPAPDLAILFPHSLLTNLSKKCLSLTTANQTLTIPGQHSEGVNCCFESSQTQTQHGGPGPGSTAAQPDPGPGLRHCTLHQPQSYKATSRNCPLSSQRQPRPKFLGWWIAQLSITLCYYYYKKKKKKSIKKYI